MIQHYNTTALTYYSIMILHHYIIIHLLDGQSATVPWLVAAGGCLSIAERFPNQSFLWRVGWFATEAYDTSVTYHNIFDNHETIVSHYYSQTQ